MNNLIGSLTPWILPSILLLGIATYALVSGWRRGRQDRYKIMAKGKTSGAVITKIGRTSRSGHCTVYFNFQPSANGQSVIGSQRTTANAIELLEMAVGSSVEIIYLPKWPRWAFSNALALAERGPPTPHLLHGGSEETPSTPCFFYSYYSDPSRPAQSSRANGFGWYGSGNVLVTDRTIQFTARRHWRRRAVQREFPLDAIFNVESFDSTVRFEISVPGEYPKRVQLWALNDKEAQALAQLLPNEKTQSFRPVMAEQAAFASTLLQVTPKTPVTPALIGANLIMFAFTTALGGGFLVANPDVMIRLGTDYTPLTMSGQWWRLLSSTFMHFGLLHIALNMWALYVNGLVAERIFGSARYLVIYLVSGLAGSVASLLWHPVVNGAGASGAIFGVLGALLAFFLMRKGGLPASVIQAQRSSAGIFVAYSLLNGVRYAGIDNAAHLGGLAGGFVMGLILARPLDVERAAKQWMGQWLAAICVVGCTGGVLAYLFTSGLLAPHLARDQAGRPIPLAALMPPIRSLGGFRLGMSAEQLLAEKGQPIHRTDFEWDYNSVDARHDGVLSVEFAGHGESKSESISVIEFFGNRESAPSDIPYLSGLSRADIVQRYGEPAASQVPTADGTTFMWFRNGIMVGVRQGKVYRYGVFDTNSR